MSKYCVKAFDADGVLICQVVDEDLLHGIDVLHQTFPLAIVKATMLDEERYE